MRPFHEVLAIDPQEKTVTVKYGEQVFTESYDALILSPGAKPLVPAIKGLEEATNAFSLRNVPDLDQIMAHLEDKSLKSDDHWRWVYWFRSR